ncbi:MAG: hypothetical protein GXY55_16580 [Phycisphaerae bacterium]|nr:hypothetical protein [Phycisphaerae bacterium]
MTVKTETDDRRLPPAGPFRRAFTVAATLCVLMGVAASAVRAEGVGGALPSGGVDQETLITRDPNLQRFDNPVWSPNGRHLAVSDARMNGVYVLDTADGACLRVTDTPSSGYMYHWSRDGGRLAFKLLEPAEGGESYQQVPVVFDVHARRLIALHGPVARAGVPSFSNNGLIAFTVDAELWLTEGDGRPVKTFGLGGYANLAPISPDGAQVAYNCDDDRIWVLDLATGGRRALTPEGEGYFGPLWSPDSAKLVVSTLTGRLKTIEVATGRVIELDEGTGPSWSPASDAVFYCRTDRIDGVRVLRSDVCAVGWDGTGRVQLTSTPSAGYIRSACVSADGASLACAGLLDGELTRLSLDRGASAKGTGLAAWSVAGVELLADATSPVTRWDGDLEYAEGPALAGEQVIEPHAPMAQILVTGTVPYLHQVYDTPNWFSGHWACGATSAQMAINYYGTLPHWDCTVSSPYSHVSHWGRYICETYTYSGYTYNIASADPNGTPATGGYGYITQNDWEETRGHMRDYIIRHGLGSSVDWSPTWSELQTEVNNNHPFVLLNSLTSSGHYITTIGYFDNQRTAIFNDPYGNKNNGYMNYYGAGVYYDWPGYSNGYSNLTKASCFIYCRGTITSPPAMTQQPASQTVAAGTSAAFAVTATGTAPLSYAWQKDGVYLSDGGRISGAGSSALSIANATVADEGDYRCVVTNAYGSQTSTQAVLAVVGTLITDFESYTDGVQVMFRHPSFSGSTNSDVASSPNTSSVVSASAFGGGKVYQVNWAFVDTDPQRWLRLTTYNTGNIPNPTIDLTRPIRFRIRLNNSGSVRVCLGIRETGVDVPIGANGGAAGTIEWLGATSETSGAPQGILISDQGGQWQTLTFDPLADPVVTFNGDGVLGVSNNKGVLEHLAFAVAGSTGPFSVDLDLFEQMISPPQILAQPASLVLCPNNAASFSVSAAGGDLSYRWQKGESDLSDGGRITGANSHTLEIAEVVSGDAGAYRCVVSNLGGEMASDAGVLNVKPATQVIEQPQSQAVGLHGTAVLTATGTGAGTLSYHWQRDGIDLDNGAGVTGVATPTLQIADFGPWGAGDYRCVVTAECGSVFSETARLDVFSPPGDFDEDGDVDLDDFAGLQQCMGSMAPFADPACASVDLSANDWVDYADLNLFLRCLTGPNIPGDPDCMSP